MRKSARVALHAATALALPMLLLAAPAAGQGVAPATEAGAMGAPAAPSYRAQIERTSYEASSGVPFTMRVRLSPGELPPGFFVTVNVERRSGPHGGRVDSLSGIPDTDISCSAPGIYRLAVSVALVTKGSCGGVEAKTLVESEIEVVVR